jgi:hypothetical protein
MHPISKLNFGEETGKIAAAFYVGNAVVNGYIVKQTGTKTFKVTADGTTIYKAKLVVAEPAAAGEMNIDAYPFVGSAVSNVAVNVKSISMNHVIAADGTKYIWSLTNPTAVGYVKLKTVA